MTTTNPAITTAAASTPSVYSVNFHEDLLELVESKGQPFVAVKRICTNLGLAWQPQHAKLTEKFGSVITEIVTAGADGKQYSMVCIPLHKLPAWLYSITLSKVAPKLRPKILAYQNESDDVLWAYWVEGVAVNPRIPQQASLTVYESIALSKERARLLELVAGGSNVALVTELYKDLQRITAALGDTVAPLAVLAVCFRQGNLPLVGTDA